MSIETKTVKSPAGDIKLYTLTNSRGEKVTLSNLGAGIVSVIVADRDGRQADVALGYDNPADYMGDGPCMGKVPGRYANRIARGLFTLDGKEYKLSINNGPNTLHGGPTGFMNRLWDAEQTAADTVRFTRVSADGEEGYPGTLTAAVTYRWTDDNRLEVKLEAETDAPTVVNLTNHAYFNLGGHDSGFVGDHILELACSHYLPTDETLIPTGEIAPVAGTPMDFTAPHPIGRDLKADFAALNYGKGYDNCWVVDGYEPGVMRTVARLVDPHSGRALEIATDQPAAQAYTGNWLKGSPRAKGGKDYDDYGGVAIECQDMPDAPNRPEFPSTRLEPGEKYERHITFRFFAE